jgi:hypothetical protein
MLATSRYVSHSCLYVVESLCSGIFHSPALAVFTVLLVVLQASPLWCEGSCILYFCSPGFRFVQVFYMLGVPIVQHAIVYLQNVLRW